MLRRLAVLCFGIATTGVGQTLEITTDNDTPITTTQIVNVGEHVRLKMRALPTGTTLTSPQWIVTGTTLKDWSTKDGEPIPLTIDDFFAPQIHLLWRDTSTILLPYRVRATALVGGSVLTATAAFRVIRDDKPEKFYSDDALMENHQNWHSVYMFSERGRRRGDLFLTWHRSQLEYFNRWRTYFGYPRVKQWDPTTAWATGTPPRPEQQHPSTTTAPAAAFSQRHDLVTLDLTASGLNHANEGEYDRVTQSSGRGRRAAFVSAAYILKSETVRGVICPTPPCIGMPVMTRTGTVTLPSWWQATAGAAADPWFAAGCPDRLGPTSCTATTKRSLNEYTLRELGESIESGTYATDFQINYHALAHIAASEDMAWPRTSMRDPIFWAWHAHIDSLLARWQTAKGVNPNAELSTYTRPAFDAAFSKVRVAFSFDVIEGLLMPANVEVNGSAATSFTNVSLTPGRTSIFEFTGFAVPASGPVELTIRREVDNRFRVVSTDPRPAATMIMTNEGRIFEPAVLRLEYNKP